MLERTRKTILIVDDSPIVLDMAGAALEAAGYKVVLRSRGEGTVAAVIQERPDLVLLDINMPRLSGETIAVILAKTDPARKTIVLLHSSIAPDLLKLKVLQTGASGYVHKTSSAHDLVAQINHWFKRGSGAHPMAAQAAVNPSIATVETAATQDAAAANAPPSSGPVRLGAAEPKHPSGTFRRNPSVLFVDDDQFTLTAYRRLFSRETFTCDIAVTGEEALRRIVSGTPPDVVVCDLLMPRMDGVQVFNSAVEHEPSFRRRFVFATGASSVLYVRKFLESVNCQVVHKPVDSEVLMRAIRLAAIAGGVFDTSGAPVVRAKMDDG
jgi:CheY-like chemotaxis protein